MISRKQLVLLTGKDPGHHHGVGNGAAGPLLTTETAVMYQPQDMRFGTASRTNVTWHSFVPGGAVKVVVLETQPKATFVAWLMSAVATTTPPQSKLAVKYGDQTETAAPAAVSKDMVYESVPLSANDGEPRKNGGLFATVSSTPKALTSFGPLGPTPAFAHPAEVWEPQPAKPSVKSPLGTRFVAAGVEAAVVVTVVVVVTSVEVKVVMEVEMETPSIITVVTVCHAVTVTLGVTVEMEVCGSQYGALCTRYEGGGEN